MYKIIYELYCDPIIIVFDGSFFYTIFIVVKWYIPYHKRHQKKLGKLEIFKGFNFHSWRL